MDFNVNRTSAMDINDSQIIQLNVGGQIFTSTRKTLTRKLGSGTHLLGNIFNTADYVYREDSLVFIDRDPEYFKYVLNYLRNPSGYLAKYCSNYYVPTDDREKALYEEFEYYNLGFAEEQEEFCE